MQSEPRPAGQPAQQEPLVQQEQPEHRSCRNSNPAAAVGNATTVDDIVEDFNALLANLRDAGLLER
ncbi:MAG: hypothetical protein ACLUR4_10355 [Blautia massiliensis (ex Durand et al. 2017)]|uniref:hypothetical protein n=1 Tax=Blautia massiliensis (ex Durand et al. 2017) TaxID=1737424 RepID=UPI0039917A2E